ncbi:hypothetical protein F0562_030267 [Nyssa sinensis]|uniref:Reverse transcriptase domain-containing protein n=1 Tax=Nyssa sinensis TaxID=561372 RepID=A0A5J5AXX6_9ASTE|nr:hypothetical protein F0562_030267 [Nyssa sinensis]
MCERLPSTFDHVYANPILLICAYLLSSTFGLQTVCKKEGVKYQTRILNSWKWMLRKRTGDNNTKVFHQIANGKQRRSFIDSLSINGVPLKNLNELKSHFFDYFQEIYKEDWYNRSLLSSSLMVDSLNDVDRRIIEEKFSEEEIWEAVKAYGGNKAPGPDGFNFLSIRKSWKFMKKEFLNFIHEFADKARLVKGLNSTFMTLVPKKENPSNPSEFRTISLIGYAYEMLDKILSYRLH